MGVAAAGEVEERVVDSRGRLYLSKRLRGRRIYLARVGGVYVVSESRSEAEEAARVLAGAAGRVVEEYLALLEELGEPGLGEVEEAARVRMWREARKAT